MSASNSNRHKLPPGPGRPKTPEEEKTVQVNFKLYPEDLRRLDLIKDCLPSPPRTRAAALRFALNLATAGCFPNPTPS